MDAAVFGQLKAALHSALIARGGDKVACAPPIGDANIVRDLAFTDNFDGTMNLTWHYYNVGDYNQDGIVGIADITPLAMHFGETRAEGENNTLAAVIDGSGDLAVNIADITPIAINFGVQFAGYLIEVSETQGGVYATEADIAMSFGQDEDIGRMSFLYNFTPTPEYWYRVIPYDNNDTQGIPSIEVQAPPPGEQFPVASIIPNPNIGFAPLTVNFSGNNSYDPDGGIITKFEWDAVGDGDFEVDGGTNPLFQYEYTEQGIYRPALRVTDDEGLTRTATATVNVVLMPDYDEVEPNNDPQSANTLPALPVANFFGSLGKNLPGYLGYDGGLQDWVSFTANDGDTVTVFCTFNSSLTVGYELRDSTGTLLASDLDTDNPQVLTYTIQPTDAPPFFAGLIGLGYSDYYLRVVPGGAPEADLVAFPVSGMAPLNVTLDAGGSTADFPIVSYEWDWEGDGIYDSNTGNTPITQYTYNVQGAYYPVVRITDENGLSDTAQATVDVWSSTYGEVEDNDTILDATAMPSFPFAGLTGSLGANPPSYPGYDGDSSDFFSFTALEGQSLSFRLDYNSGTLQAGMNLYDGSGSLIQVSGIYSGAQVSHTFLPWEAGVAAVEVGGVNGYGDYVLMGVEGTPPDAELTASPRNGDPPLTPVFDASESWDDGAIVKYEFDFLGDGAFELDNGANPTALFEYNTVGVYVAAVRVTDNDGFTDIAKYTITVGPTGYDEVEDNDWLGTANQLPILPVIGYQASIGDSPPLYSGYDGDTVDWFFFVGPAIGDTVTVTITYGPTLTANVALVDNYGTSLGYYFGASPAVISYKFKQGDSAPWFVYMEAVDGFGDYSISVYLGAPPNAVLYAAPTSGSAPLLVNFDATNSWDMDGFIIGYDYDWDGDGTYDLVGGTSLEAYEYTVDGRYTPTLRVTDNNGFTDTDARWVFVGAVPYSEREHNDFEVQANPLPPFPFGGFTGSVGSSDSHPGYDGDEYDYSTFVADEGDMVDLSLIFNYNDADLDFTLIDSDGDFLWGSYNWKDNEYINYTFQAGDASPFYLVVEGWDRGVDYTISGSLI